MSTPKLYFKNSAGEWEEVKGAKFTFGGIEMPTDDEARRYIPKLKDFSFTVQARIRRTLETDIMFGPTSRDTPEAN